VEPPVGIEPTTYSLRGVPGGNRGAISGAPPRQPCDSSAYAAAGSRRMVPKLCPRRPGESHRPDNQPPCSSVPGGKGGRRPSRSDAQRPCGRATSCKFSAIGSAARRQPRWVGPRWSLARESNAGGDAGSQDGYQAERGQSPGEREGQLRVVAVPEASADEPGDDEGEDADEGVHGRAHAAECVTGLRARSRVQAGRAFPVDQGAPFLFARRDRPKAAARSAGPRRDPRSRRRRA
jgi:hypothetical protein